MAEILKSSSYEHEIMGEVKKLLKINIKPSMNKVNDKFISFEEELSLEQENNLSYD